MRAAGCLAFVVIVASPALGATNVASAQVKTPPPATKTTQGTKTPPPATGTKTPPPATGTKTPPPATGTKSPAAATKTQAAPTTPATKTPPAATKGVPAAPPPAGTKAPGGQGRALSVAPERAQAPRIPVIMREVFEYSDGGRRDPFFSLLATPELRPTIADLRLVGVLYDESGQRPVAIMRDLSTNAQYRVTTGMTLGRMRVTAIVPRKVVFTIEEFGLNRQDSLVLRKR